MDCFVALLPAMTPPDMRFAIPRREAPGLCLNFPPSPIRGRRECRAPDAPDSRVCNDSSRTHTR